MNPAGALILAGVIFGTGAIIFLTRATPLILLMAIEVMFSGANLALLAAGRAHGGPEGQVAALLVIAVAAAEAAVGLAILVMIYRREPETTVDGLSRLKG